MRDILKTAVALAELSQKMGIDDIDGISKVSLGIQIGITLARIHPTLAQQWTDCWDERDPENEQDRHRAADILAQTFEDAVPSR